MSHKPMKEGWVNKRSKYLHKWRQRWLVLTPQTLTSYKSTQGKQTLQIQLEEVSEVSPCPSERENCLQVLAKGSRYVLQFSDETDLNNWNSLIINLKKFPLRANSILANQICEQKSNTEISLISVFRSIKEALNAREAELTSKYEECHMRSLDEGHSNLVELEKALSSEKDDYRAFQSSIRDSEDLIKQTQKVKDVCRLPRLASFESKMISVNLNQEFMNKIIKDNARIRSVNPAEMSIRRTNITRALKWKYTGNRVDCLSFKVNQTVSLSGIGLCGPYKENGETAVKSLQVLRGARSDAVVVYTHSKKETMKHDPETSVHKIQFESDVNLTKGTSYTIICCLYGDCTYKCVDCFTQVKGGANETWIFNDTLIAPHHVNNRCDTFCGPIADFYYIPEQFQTIK